MSGRRNPARHGEYDIVLANPPFGNKTSVIIVNEVGETSKESLTINRDDFWASTSKCEPHWHCSSSGSHRTSTSSPFSSSTAALRWCCRTTSSFEGGAGETIRRALLKQADVHTLVRLPTGIFYAQGSDPDWH